MKRKLGVIPLILGFVLLLFTVYTYIYQHYLYDHHLYFKLLETDEAIVVIIVSLVFILAGLLLRRKPKTK